MSTINNLAANLTLLRTTQNLSQEEVAGRAGVDRSYLSGLETASRNPTLEVLDRLAGALSVAPEQLIVPPTDVLNVWRISATDLSSVIWGNPSLRGMVSGYLAETQIAQRLRSMQGIGAVTKPDDHDREKKYDLVFEWKGREVTMEVKALQTNSIRSEPNGRKIGTFQCDASDRRSIQLDGGGTVETTCLRYGDFDIVGVCLFGFTGKWEYAFAHNRDLPQTTGRKYDPDVRAQLIKSSIGISLPLEPPFTADLRAVLDRVVGMRGR